MKKKNTVHEENNRHICQYCDQEFPSKNVMNEHITSVHKVCPEVMDENGEIPDRIHEGIRLYLCYVCNMWFEDSLLRKRHMHQAHEGKNNTDKAEKRSSIDEDKIISGDDLENTVEYGPPEEPCKEEKPVCPGDKNITLISQEEDEVIPADKLCTICKKVFQTLQNKQLHIKRVHEKEKPFKCDMCTDSFVNNFGLIRHIERVHLKIKNFKCDVCDKKFSTAFTLAGHNKTTKHLKNLGQL